FSLDDLADLRLRLPSIVRRLFSDYEDEYSRRGWKMFTGIDRVYVNERARNELGWRPEYDFRRVLGRLKDGEEPRSALSQLIGSKGYHNHKFADGPYPVE